MRAHRSYVRHAGEVAWTPLFPEDRDQGDPFVVRVPDDVPARFRYYVYATGEGAELDGRAFSVFASHDLTAWTRLPQHALVADRTKAHWAPSVTYVPGLARPWVMLYSRAIGVGDDAHVGHHIYRADATSPEGPFEPSGRSFFDELDFAIDPDVFRRKDGNLALAFALDFTADEPLGTGLAVAGINEDLTEITAAPVVLARASADWQVYDPARAMPWKKIRGIDWTRGDRVRWYCLEGPSGGLVSPRGREVILYSGGCFFGFYAVGALVENEQHAFADASCDCERLVLGARADLGITATGHCSHTTAPDGSTVLFFHARWNNGPRQFTLAPLRWTEDDLPVAGQ